MKNNKGYTIVELIIVIAVVSLIAFIGINKASYAFSENEVAEKELVNQTISLIENQAVKYAEEHKELFEESNTTYIRVNDLIENKYLLDIQNDNKTVDNNSKIKLVFKEEKVEAHLEV